MSFFEIPRTLTTLFQIFNIVCPIEKGQEKTICLFFKWHAYINICVCVRAKKNCWSGYWQMSAQEIVYFIWHLIQTEGRMGFMGRGHLQSSSEPNIYYGGWKLAVDLSYTMVHCRLDSAPVLVLHVTAIIYRHFKYEYIPVPLS